MEVNQREFDSPAETLREHSPIALTPQPPLPNRAKGGVGHHQGFRLLCLGKRGGVRVIELTLNHCPSRTSDLIHVP